MREHRAGHPLHVVGLNEVAARRSAAIACDVRNRAIDARGLPPRLRSSCSRVAWTISVR